MTSFSEPIKADYQRLFDSCIVRESKYPVTKKCEETIFDGRNQYKAIASTTAVPSYFTGFEAEKIN